MSLAEFKVPTAFSASVLTPNENKHDRTTEDVIKDVIETRTEKDGLHLDVVSSYKIPTWSTKPKENLNYKFEVLKMGSIVETIDNLQSKEFWQFGRFPANDIVMAHPTISRFHCVLQYKPKAENIKDEKNQNIYEKQQYGWFIFDLGSTHGTFINKMRIPSKTYIKMHVGHMLKLGGSTRTYILQGPESDQEPESEYTITEIKELRKKQLEEERKINEMQELAREKEGIDWGMGEDADEATDLAINPYASTNNEDLFLNDPKKTLRGFFEREGIDLEYKVNEMSPGTFLCRIELPVDDLNGKPISAEICHKGKKKDCVFQCAMEACKILDRYGMLRRANHEPRKRKVQNSDSDDDDFLDRTGDIEKKKIKKSSGNKNSALSYDELVIEEKKLIEKIQFVDKNISEYQEQFKKNKQELIEPDDLDAFMNNLSSTSKLDKSDIRKLRIERQNLNSDHEKLKRLISIAKPFLIPLNNENTNVIKSDLNKKTLLPLYGKRSKLKVKLAHTAVKPIEKELKSDEEEFEEVSQKEKKLIYENCIEKSVEVSEELTKKIIGPTSMPSVLITNETIESETYDNDNNKSDNSVHENFDESKSNEKETNSNKKKKSRTRIRPKFRENIDMDDAEEFIDATKYSGWLPPENQTGDGFTSLNKKLGY